MPAAKKDAPVKAEPKAKVPAPPEEEEPEPKLKAEPKLKTDPVEAVGVLSHADLSPTEQAKIREPV